MCGIVGYIGNKEVAEILVNSLARLEYRGYDSAGIASVKDGKVHILKEKGKLKNLRDVLSKNPLGGSVGIAHTRWATHGEPSQINAHPHTDATGTVAVVHNGIIENYAVIKERLTAQGYQFASDTDTEALLQLIAYYHVGQNEGLEKAVRLALNEIEGSYALCVISKKEPERFIAARNGSPLVVGLGEGQNFVASDAPALVEHTRRVIFLEDFNVAVVEKDHVRLTTLQGDEIEQVVSEIDWDAEAANKDGFEHFMLKEIEEQPAVVERLVKNRLSKGGKIFDSLKFDEAELKGVKRVILQACGTSWHAALTGKFLIESLAGIPAEVDVSSEFRYREILPQENAVVICITQSGETIDTLMGLREAKKVGYKTLAICNVLGSTIAREADGVIYTHAGPEIGVASTKAYTAQLGVLLALSIYWGKIRQKLSVEAYDDYIKEIRLLPDKMRQIITNNKHIRAVAGKYFHCRDFLFMARGINYPNAHEGALKIKEIAYLHATGHPAGEMKHGPIALIDEHMPVVCIAPHAATYDKMVSNVQEIKARHGRIIGVVTEGDKEMKKISEDIIEIPDCHENVSPLLVALPLQYLSYYVAVLRGTDVDQPRNLAKSVTVE